MTDLLYDIFSQAGPVLTIIFLLSCWAWYFAVKKFLWFKEQKEAELALLGEVPEKNISNRTKNSFFFQLAKGIDGSNADSENFLIMEKSLKLAEVSNKNLGTINTCAALAPLLGLLGTVTGMIKTFSIIQLFGGSNPALMADGISEALLTTQGGLIVAFPLVLVHSWLRNRAAKLDRIFSAYCIKKRENNV